MILYYGGEDDVTKGIARRLALYVTSQLDIEVEMEDVGIRERGEAIKSKLSQLIRLGKQYPVIFVFDSDGNCVVEILRAACPQGWENSFCTLNLAIDEGESWLLADRAGFSDYFGISMNDILFPENEKEVSYPYKTSLYIMKNLIPKSKKKEVIENMSCTDRGKKPPTYNMLWGNYINAYWNIEEAEKHADSLKRAIKRIESRLLQYMA